MKILAAFLAVLAVVAASKPQLFSAVTMFAGKNTATASHLVTIDPESGAIGDLMETFYYAGSSITADGISAYDFLNGVYYYATDGNSAFVFRGDVRSKTLMSPIAFPFGYIYELTYDVSQQRIIVAGTDDKQGDFLVAFPTDESKPWSVIAQIETDYSFDCGTLDSENQIYYWLSMQKVNNTFSNLFLHSIALSNPTKITTVQVMCTYPMMYPDTIRYDPLSKQLYVFSAEWIVKGKKVDFVYYIETVSTTGACNALKTQLPNGIVGDWAYDPVTQNAYAAWAGDTTDNYIYTLNVKTGKVLTGAIVGNKLMPESMQFSYV